MENLLESADCSDLKNPRVSSTFFAPSIWHDNIRDQMTHWAIDDTYEKGWTINAFPDRAPWASGYSARIFGGQYSEFLWTILRS